MEWLHSITHKMETIMRYTVEYMFKYGTRAYTDSPTIAPFPTLDQALSFIEDMKKVFANSIEWIYIHCLEG